MTSAQQVQRVLGRQRPGRDDASDQVGSARRIGVPRCRPVLRPSSRRNSSSISRHTGCTRQRAESENDHDEVEQEVEREQADPPRPCGRRAVGRGRWLDPAADHVELPAASAVVLELPADRELSALAGSNGAGESGSRPRHEVVENACTRGRRGLLRGWASGLRLPNNHRRLRERSLVRAGADPPILVTGLPRPHPARERPRRPRVDVSRAPTASAR